MKKFKKSQHEPKMIEICGEKYPAIFTMAAMAEVEEAAGMPYAVFFDRLANNEGTIKEQCALICACLHAGGTDVAIEDLMSSLDLVNDFPVVLAQVVEMVTGQMPEAAEAEDSGKN